METIMSLRKFNKTSLRDEAYLSLKRTILTGEISQGQGLAINWISKLTGFSATPIREAILKLEQDGIVSRLPSGNFIVRRFSQKEIEDILDLRMLLEPFAIAEASDHIRPENIGWLVENVERAEACIGEGKMSDVSALNTAFHNYLNVLSNNQMLVEVLQGLGDKIWMNRSTALWAPGKGGKAIIHHKKIIEALRKRDVGQLKRIAKGHILHAKKIILAEIEKKTALYRL